MKKTAIKVTTTATATDWGGMIQVGVYKGPYDTGNTMILSVLLLGSHAARRRLVNPEVLTVLVAIFDTKGVQ